MATAARRPVVLIVEDELLLRIDAADMIAEAGFDVVEAANADEAIAILEGAAGHSYRFYRYPDAGVDGRSQAGAVHQGKVAADQAGGYLWTGGDTRRRPSGRRGVYRQALHVGEDLGDPSTPGRLDLKIHAAPAISMAHCLDRARRRRHAEAMQAVSGFLHCPSYPEQASAPAVSLTSTRL